MPQANLTAFNLEGASPEQLEQRRKEIVALYSVNGMKIEEMLKDMSLDHLRELAALTAALRRRTTPSVKTTAKRGKAAAPKQSADDLLSGL